MEISTVSITQCDQDTWLNEESPNQSDRNSRIAHIISKAQSSNPFLSNNMTTAKIRPMMGKPDRADVELSGGYDETSGGHIEGKISISWGESKTPEESQQKSSNDQSAPD